MFKRQLTPLLMSLNILIGFFLLFNIISFFYIDYINKKKSPKIVKELSNYILNDLYPHFNQLKISSKKVISDNRSLSIEIEKIETTIRFFPNHEVLIEGSIETPFLVYIYPKNKEWYCIGTPSYRVPEYCQDTENNLVPRK